METRAPRPWPIYQHGTDPREPWPKPRDRPICCTFMTNCSDLSLLIYRSTSMVLILESLDPNRVTGQSAALRLLAATSMTNCSDLSLLVYKSTNVVLIYESLSGSKPRDRPIYQHGTDPREPWPKPRDRPVCCTSMTNCSDVSLLVYRSTSVVLIFESLSGSKPRDRPVCCTSITG
ncbi:hypothetical protein J6590_002785 [Homalodisca vitripennis]|nr:hypothetical protein J6590_002785 [Homalodisca vitripennis]